MFCFVCGVRKKGWKGGRRQRKARASASLFNQPSTSKLGDKLRLLILLNSVNILPEALPWAEHGADNGEISEEDIFY